MLGKTRFGHVPDRVFLVCRYVWEFVARRWTRGPLFWVAGMRSEVFAQVEGLTRTSKSTINQLGVADNLLDEDALAFSGA